MQSQAIETAGAEAVAPSFTVKRKPLLAALNFLCRHVIQRRNTVPILSNVALCVADDGGLSIMGTDLDQQAEFTLPAEWAAPGSITVDAVALRDTLKKAKVDSLTLTFEGARVLITGGRFRFNVSALPVDDFPVMPAPAEPLAFTVPADRLGRDLVAVSPAMSTEETRYYLNGVLAEEREGQFYLVATDGHQLARVERPAPKGAEGLAGAIIPRRTVAALIAALKKADDSPLSVEIADDRATIAAGGLRLAFKLVDGLFPDWRPAIPGALGDSGLQRVGLVELEPRLASDSIAKLGKAVGAPLSVETGESAALLTCPDFPEWLGLSLFLDPGRGKFGLNAYAHADAAAVAYLRALAEARGFDVPEDCRLAYAGELIMGATFGKAEWIDPEPVEVIDWERIGAPDAVRIERAPSYLEYEEGAFSVAMPRERQATVSVDHVGDDGVEAFHHLRTDAAGRMEIGKETVRALCGDVDQAARIEIKPLRFLHGRVVEGMTVPTFTVPGVKKPTDRDKMAAYCANPAGVMKRLRPSPADQPCRIAREKEAVAAIGAFARAVAALSIATKAEISPAERPREAPGTPEPVHPEKTLSEPETAPEPHESEPRPVEAGGDMAESLRALADRVAALEAAARPSESRGTPLPVESEPASVPVESRDRRAARLRIARRYLAMRRERAEMRAIIADQGRRVDTLGWENGAFTADAEKDVRAREALESELAKVKAQLAEARKPKHPNAPAPDVVAQLHRERKEAAAKLADAERRASEAEARAHAAAETIEALAGRAIRAEQALQVYRVQAMPLSFGGMAAGHVSYGEAGR